MAVSKVARSAVRRLGDYRALRDVRWNSSFRALFVPRAIKGPSISL
jgi:hypothetical protein